MPFFSTVRSYAVFLLTLLCHFSVRMAVPFFSAVAVFLHDDVIMPFFSAALGYAVFLHDDVIMPFFSAAHSYACLLYTSDAADD